MANAEITPVGLGELPLIADLYNEVFRPGRDQSLFERRLQGRMNPLLLIAHIRNQPVGFAVGYENKPGTFYCWLIGVRPDYRRSGIASQLMEAMRAWAADNDYHTIRFECFNTQRPMLHLGIRQGYDVVGIRYDTDTNANLLILEHNLSDDEER